MARFARGAFGKTLRHNVDARRGNVRFQRIAHPRAATAKVDDPVGNIANLKGNCVHLQLGIGAMRSGPVDHRRAVARANPDRRNRNLARITMRTARHTLDDIAGIVIDHDKGGARLLRIEHFVGEETNAPADQRRFTRKGTGGERRTTIDIGRVYRARPNESIGENLAHGQGWPERRRTERQILEIWIDRWRRGNI